VLETVPGSTTEFSPNGNNPGCTDDPVRLGVWEGGDGPPLLFLHGAGGFRGDHVFIALPGKRRRITAPSHPGFGASSLPNWIDRPDDIAHIYLNLPARIFTGPVDLVACSLGGWIGAELASMVPERFRRIVFVGPVGEKLGSRQIPGAGGWGRWKTLRRCFHHARGYHVGH
jgi:pimeloyl-ACP methyl ester carboxylesterase